MLKPDLPSLFSIAKCNGWVPDLDSLYQKPSANRISVISVISVGGKWISVGGTYRSKLGGKLLRKHLLRRKLRGKLLRKHLLRRKSQGNCSVNWIPHFIELILDSLPINHKNLILSQNARRIRCFSPRGR